MWPPRWLGTKYCLLYSEYRDRPFSFDEAGKVLKIPSERLKVVLGELRREGFLFSEREGRKTLYFLSGFESIATGIRASEELRGLSLEDLLRRCWVDYSMAYLLVGEYAAFYYHGYQLPKEVRVKVFPKDYGFWAQVLGTRSAIPELAEEGFKERKEVDGIFLEPPERVVLDGIARGSYPRILDSLAIMVSKARELDWNRLIGLAVGMNLASELGALIEATNLEAERLLGRRILPAWVLEELRSRVSLRGRRRLYPRIGLERSDSYAEIGKKWGLRFVATRDPFLRVVEDLGAFQETS